MREIKFRAKVCKPLGKVIFIPSYRKEGEWIIGDLHLRTNIPHIHECGNDKFPIDINTIGQFTGLYDKNGKEIYEGDIVKMSTAEYGDEIFRIGYEDSHIGAFCLCSAGTEDTSRFVGIFGRNYGYEPFYCEVIGNIHDNPELLEANQ